VPSHATESDFHAHSFVIFSICANAAPDEFIVRPQSDAAELARKYTLTSASAPRLARQRPNQSCHLSRRRNDPRR
jgi:hypothetical protein